MELGLQKRSKRKMELGLQKRSKRRMIVDAEDLPYLPQELLQLIFTKLTSIYDRVGFRSVCRSWRSVGPVWDHIQFRTISSPCRPSAAIPSDLHPLQPLLILPSNCNERSTLSFYNPCQRRVYDFYLPEAEGKDVFGSSHGWLVLVDDFHKPSLGRAVSLLNPITRAQVLLPRFPEIPELTFPSVRLRFSPSDPPRLAIPNVLLRFNPSASARQYIVIIWYASFLLVFREGADDWAVIMTTPVVSNFSQMEYFEEEIYLLDYQRNLLVLDMASLTLRSLTKTHTPRYRGFALARRLVEAAGDLLLVVFETINMKWRPRDLKLRCSVFKLDKSGRIWKWERAGRDGLRDNTLFISCMQTISLSTRDFPDIRANQFYIIDTEFCSPEDPAKMAACTKVFDVVDGVGYTTTYHRSELDGLGSRIGKMPGLTWIVPNLH